MKTNFLSPFYWARLIFGFLQDVYRLFRKNVLESIRLQLIITFVICLVASLIVFALSNSFFGEYYKSVTIDYSSGKQDIDNTARSIINDLNNYNEGRYEPDAFNNSIRSQSAASAVSQDQWIKTLIANYSHNNKILILDLEGKVLYKSPNATETQVDIHNIIRNAMDARFDYISSPQEFSSFYPFDLNDMKGYLVVNGIPSPNLIRNPGDSPLSIVFGLAAFILLFYFLTKRKMKYIEELAGGLLEISKGNLHYRVVTRSRDELGSLAGNINHMTQELQNTIEEERKAEKTKNELITNVSHDLRTPLTLIMGYLRLLKDKNYEDEQQADHYINVAYGKSEKLKSLIEDLFEYTKLSNQGVKLNSGKVCINELLEQLLEELVSYSEENEVKIIKELPAERLMVDIDTDKMIRVFENLLTNAVKYSYKPGRIKVRMWKEDDCVNVCMSNYGEPLSNEDLSRLFDRFFRAEKSRSSVTGGSGLGLAIAKSIVELHGGDIWADSVGDEIRFFVKLKLQR